MKRIVLGKKFIATMLLGTAILAGCGDDDDFAPVSRNRGYDYSLTSTKEFADYPCNDVREGREAVVGRDKESYYCQFDYRDSVYIWAGYDDTLTATGKEFVRSESSSSSRGSSSSRASSSSSVRSSNSSQDWDGSRYFLTEKGEQFNPDIDYGTMTDPRDGKTYRTVQIEGMTWMAENLNYADNKVGISHCFNDNEEICNLYGRLYSRDAAMNSSNCAFSSTCSLGSEPIQGICPDGWHIPTYSETQVLVDLADRKAQPLMATMGWGVKDSLSVGPGTDTYGLSFVGTGLFDYRDNYSNIGQYAYMWVYYQERDMYYLLIRSQDNEAYIFNFGAYEAVLSVRCVKGDGIPASSSSSARSSSSNYSSSSSSYTSENPSSSFSISSKEDLFNPDLTYDTMKDPRDGKTYKTIEFNGKTWMAENLNFSDSSIVPLLEGHNTCYHEKESECELFGRLYDRIAVMNDSRCEFKEDCNLGDGPIQGICPDGWHVLTYGEATSMIAYVGAKHAEKIMSAKGWGSSINGENTYGLSFIAPGTRDGNIYDSKGGYAYYWVYKAATDQYFIYINGDSEAMTTTNYSGQRLFLPVRCIKDE